MFTSAGKRRLRHVAVVGALVSLVVPGAAAAGWDPVEPIPPSANAFRVELAPGGPGYVVGFPLTGPSRFRYAERPIGGTLSASPLEFPGTLGTNYDGFWRFDATGNAVVANMYDNRIGYIPAGGGIGGSSQDLPGGYSPDALSVAPTGEALIAAAPSSGSFRVALRAAGPGQVADFSPSAQTFGGPSAHLVDLLLQADGGAVVVWLEGDNLWQSVRRSGQYSFDQPTQISDPRPDVRKFSVRMRGDSSGHAMLAWLGSSGGFARDQAVASVRAPDGSFGSGQIVGTGGSVVNVTPSMTSTGDGLAVWSHVYSGICPPSTVMGAAFHAGAFAAQQPLGPSAFPLTSSQGFPDTVMAAGDRVAVPILEIEAPAGTECGSGNNRRGLFVHHFRSGPSGLVDEGISELSPLQAKPGGATSYPLINEQTLEPGGRMLVSYQVDGVKYLRSFDGVPPGASAPPAPPAPPPSSPAPPGVTPPPAVVPPKAILPIHPVQYVKVRPINPDAADISLTCVPEVGLDGESCRVRMLVYYTFIGRFSAKKSFAAAAAKSKKTKKKAKSVLIASASATIRNGKTRKVRLHFTKTGRALIARRKSAKVVLKLTLTRGSRKATQRFPTTLKAKRKTRHR